jgi:mannose-6-phosphate isomerase-like protein (cupin superfamily)
MSVDVINLNQKFSLFTDRWAPKIISQMNDYHIKLARIKGEFIWHSHPETDEMFLVLKGSMRIYFQDSYIELKKGELCVVPKGIEHKPMANQECHIMIIEPQGTANTGDAGGDFTADDVWI